MHLSDPVILPSARRHGIADDDILHAYRNPISAWEMDEGMTMLVGPDTAARTLEIGVVDSEEGPVIVHAMRARAKFLQRRR
ncbi:hypothetical protein EV191_12828 [Tamaricihabitans halophyticus]|uniref:Toxin n=1 Tax=Tamaricihabitans halophyticus TaxID=1262583 RepID=A0A4R2PZU4_9PSEU|nr:hypothetical protein [Tamaricihabitans halophyticus]TCP40778.1 hypothetical protein EV191_12828 [Tamaricihabitans halophyticus]